MEESTYEAIFTGTFILIFLGALTLTLYLFNSVSEIADKSYEFGNKAPTSAVILNATVEDNRYLKGSEVVIYIYNYIQKDIFDDVNKNYATKDYVLRVKTANGKIIEDKYETNDKSVYKSIIRDIKMTGKYTLKYESITAEGKINILIEEVK